MTNTTKPENSSWFKELLKRLGFYHFQWFRRWYGGCWVRECDFHTYICEQNRHPRRYPDQFIGEGFRWILAQEDYR